MSVLQGQLSNIHEDVETITAHMHAIRLHEVLLCFGASIPSVFSDCLSCCGLVAGWLPQSVRKRSSARVKASCICKGFALKLVSPWALEAKVNVPLALMHVVPRAHVLSTLRIFCCCFSVCPLLRACSLEKPDELQTPGPCSLSVRISSFSAPMRGSCRAEKV